MADVKNKIVSVTGKISTKSVDGERRIVFAASSNGLDRHYEHVDVGSLRLPLKGGGDMVVSSIPEGGVSDMVDIPLMLNHSGDVRDVIGSVRTAYYENGELVFEAGISSTETAQTMLTLLEEGHLSNAFSITMIDFDYNSDSDTIHNAEIIEVSLVYRGSNKEARLLAIKSLLGGDMPEVEKTEKQATEETTPEAPKDEAPQPAEAETETQEPAKSEAEDEAKVEETEEESETPAKPESDENNTNDNLEGETAMEKEIAKDQVIAKAVMPEQETATTDYLGSKKAIEDFAGILKSMAGKDAKDVKAAWTDHLKEKGVSNPEALLPGALVNAISDTLKESGSIWNTIDKTGLTVFRANVNTVGIDNENGRGRGHKKGKNKAEQVITLVDRVIRGQYIYKYITLNKEDVRENQDTGALVKYVLTELPKRVVAEIERAMIIGDGRASDSDDKINSFVSIKADAADANTPFATTYVPADGEPLYKSIIKAAAQIEADGDVYLVMNKTAKAELTLSENNGGLVFPLGSDIKAALGVKDIFTPSWMNSTNDSTNQAYLYVGRAYKGVGDNTPEAFTDFALKQNKQEYLEEVYAGGALAEAYAAVAIASTAESE